MAYDIVIRSGTVVDGSGLGSYRADVGIVGDRIAFVGPIRERGAQRDRRRGPCRDPRVHRRPHPHGRPGVLGRHRVQLLLARGDLGGHGQLRLHPGPGAARGARPGGAQPRARRGHRSGRAGSRHRLELRDLPPVPRCRRPAAQGHQLRRQGRALGPAHLGHGRAGLRGRGRRRPTWSPCRASWPSPWPRAPSGSPRRAPMHHETSDNRPVASRLAAWDEVAALVGVMGSMGAGIFETADSGMSDPDPDRRRHGLDRMRDLAARTQVPVTFGLVATKGSGYLLDFLDDAAASGARCIAQTHCRGISVLLSLKTRLPFDLIPAWAELRTLDTDEQLRILADPERRRPYVEAAVGADYDRMAGGRRPGPAARLRGHPGLSPRAAAQPVGGRRRPPARGAPGRGHDRPVRRVARRPAVHPAQPVPPGRDDAPPGPPPSRAP